MTKLFLFLCIAVTYLSSCNLLEEPVTPQEALAFGKEIERSFADRNPTLFNNILDVRTFAEKIEEASEGKIKHAQLSSLPEELRKKQLGTEIIKGNGEDGTYQLVKQYEKGAKQHLIFRLYGTNGLNYHDIEVVRNLDKLKAGDIYIFMTGENLSKTLSDVLLELENYYDGKSANEKAGFAMIKELKKLTTEKKYLEAQKKLDSLPMQLKEQKSFQLLNLEITSAVNDNQYKQALEKFTSLFPNDPNQALILIDHCLLRKNYEGALNNINKLDSIINKDPFLDFYRANIFNAKGDTMQAIKYYERLHKTLPEFADGIIELTYLYLNTKQDDKAKGLMKEYKAKKLDQEKLFTLKLLYPDFSF